ncbi:MAG: Gx transporter family protein [Bacillota bacterium]
MGETLVEKHRGSRGLQGQRMQVSRTFKVVYLALLVSLAVGLHAVEALLPLPFLFPGAKLGLANIVALYTVATFGLGEALTVSLLRVLLGGLVGGTFMSAGFFLGLSGAVISTLFMAGSLGFGGGHLGLVGVSLVGAVSHNVAQLVTAMFLVGHPGLLLYLPYLLAFALPTGTFVGLVTLRLKAASDRLMVRNPH